MKKYRINESEHFNLLSMYEHLKCLEIDMEESNIYDKELEKRITEVESLLNKAPYIGAQVDWETLKRIREIKNERQFIRYMCSLKAGSSEKEAGLAFTV